MRSQVPGEAMLVVTAKVEDSVATLVEVAINQSQATAPHQVVGMAAAKEGTNHINSRMTTTVEVVAVTQVAVTTGEVILVEVVPVATVEDQVVDTIKADKSLATVRRAQAWPTPLLTPILPLRIPPPTPINLPEVVGTKQAHLTIALAVNINYQPAVVVAV